MSKRVKTMIGAILALVLVAAAVVAVLLLPSEGDGENEGATTTTTQAADIVIVDKSTDSDGNAVEAPVVQMDIENATGSYSVVTREDNTMAVEEYSDLLADTTLIKAMCDDMAYLTALATPAMSDEESAYGFTSPTASVTVTYHDGSTHTVVFGAQSQGTAGYYCRVDGDDTLYIVDTAIAEQFTVEGKYLIGKALISAPMANADDTEGTGQLFRLWLSGSVRDEAIELVTDTDASYPGLTYVSTMVMTSPYLRAIDSDNFLTVQSTITTLTAIDVEAVHPTTEQLDAYGLSDPHSVAAFTLAVMSTTSADDGGSTTSHYNDREHMIILGNTNEDGYYYALIDGYDIVYLLTPSSVPWAELRYIDITSKLLFMKEITQVDTVTVTENGKATTFSLAHHPEKESRDEQMVVTSGGKTYDTAEFRILYQMMIGIHRVADAEEGATAEGTPVMSLEMTFNDGSAPMEISLYPMTGSRYLCVTEDGELTAVSIRDVEDFLTQYHNYLTGEPVLSPY